MQYTCCSSRFIQLNVNRTTINFKCALHNSIYPSSIHLSSQAKKIINHTSHILRAHCKEFLYSLQQTHSCSNQDSIYGQ